MNHKNLKFTLGANYRFSPKVKDSYQILKIFDVGDTYYLLMFDYENDTAYLVSEEGIDTEQAILIFYPDCCVGLPDGSYIGHSSISADNLRWEFTYNTSGFNKPSVQNSHPEAIFDLEVEVSKDYLLRKAVLKLVVL